MNAVDKMKSLVAVAKLSREPIRADPAFLRQFADDAFELARTPEGAAQIPFFVAQLRPIPEGTVMVVEGVPVILDMVTLG